ncbi:Alpha-1,3-mannosyl-glycoprotein 2-beta-N-acetylglucosaminyltransferase, partial [Thalictrum thalictroides]
SQEKEKKRDCHESFEALIRKTKQTKYYSSMAVRNICDVRILLFAAAAAFIYIQMRLFATQSEYADRLAAAVESEIHCTSQMRLLIDQISMQQGRIVALEETKKRQDEESGQLRALVHDLESMLLLFYLTKSLFKRF